MPTLLFDMDKNEIRSVIENCTNRESLGTGMCYECCPLRENGICTFDAGDALRVLHAEPYEREMLLWEYIKTCLGKEEPSPLRKAVYGGSFNPFHNGHMDIVKQASALFDEVYVVIFRNAEKDEYNTDTGPIRKALDNEGIKNCHVECSEIMLADFCRKKGIGYSIRGLRNSMDYAYEENIACANKMLYPGLETVYLRAKQEGVSSSCLREFLRYGKDISDWVPPAIAESLGVPRVADRQEPEPGLCEVLGYFSGGGSIVSEREKLKVCLALSADTNEADRLLGNATENGTLKEKATLLSLLLAINFDSVPGDSLMEKYSHMLHSILII